MRFAESEVRVEKKKKKKSEELDAVAFYWSARGPPESLFSPFLASTEKQASDSYKTPQRHDPCPPFFHSFLCNQKQNRKKHERSLYENALFLFFLLLLHRLLSLLFSIRINQSTLSNTAKHSTWSAPGKKIRAAP